MSQLSLAALFAGVLTAYGAFAVLISLVAGFARGASFTRTLSGGTWDHLGTTGGVLVAKTILDRTGYPKHPSTWSCSSPAPRP